jgi:hypothetical protein
MDIFLPSDIMKEDISLKKGAYTKRKIIWMFLVCICLPFSLDGFSSLHAASKAGADKQKKGSSSKVVIEQVSFPDVLKRYDVYPWETAGIEEFKKAYTEMLASKNHEEWVRSLTGTGNKNKMLNALQKHLVMITFCKPHFCDANQMLILFNPVLKKCYAISAEDGKFNYLGTPDDSTKNLLKILLVDEYKEIYKGQ